MRSKHLNIEKNVKGFNNAFLPTPAPESVRDKLSLTLGRELA